MSLLLRQLARTTLAVLLVFFAKMTSSAQDDCASAIPISVGASCISNSYTSIGATSEPTTIAANPACGNFQGGDVWFTFIVPASGDFRIEMTSAGNNSVWELYSGTCGSFTSIQCASATSDQLKNFSEPSLAGQTLYLRTWRFNSAAGIDFDLCIGEISIPANNNCASSTNITVGTSCSVMSYSSQYSTAEDVSVAPNPTCGGYQGGDVWFNFVAPASGNFRIEMSSTGNNSQWQLYSGSCGAFTPIKCASSSDDLNSNFSDASLAGQTLYLRSWRFNNSSGIDFDLCVTEITPPVNNNCANPTTITVGSTCTPASYSSMFATSEDASVATNPACGILQEGDVWFNFVAPASGNFRIEMSSTGNNSQWQLYSGSCGAFTPIKCASNGDDLNSNFSDASLAGQTLYLRSWRFNNSSGIDFDLCVTEITPPVNNNCANATTITVGSTCTPASYSSMFATSEDASVATNPACGILQEGDVWFNFVAPASGNFRIEMSSTGNNSQWQLYSGSCGAFTPIKCASNGDDLNSNFSDASLASQTLYLRSWRFNGSSGIDFDLCVTEISPPANDNCVNAINLILNDSCVATTTSSEFATSENISVAPNPSCGIYQEGDIWYSFTAPPSGQFSIDKINIIGSTHLTVYTGSCGNFTEVDCDNSTAMAFNDPTLGGQVMFIRAHRFNSSQGADFELCIRNTTIAANDNCANAISLTVNNTCTLEPFDSFNTTEEAGIAPTPSCGVYNGGDVWFSFVVPSSGQVQLNKNNVSGGTFFYTLYTGTCSNFTEILCEDGPQFLLNDISLAGQTLYMRIYRFNSTFGGEFELCLVGGDCNGVIGGAAIPGSSCDDGNVCTENDSYDNNCNCTGTFMDSDNDGTCDANDLCPGGPEPGTSCDDGDATTGNDVILPDCSCTGLLIDCEGMPGGSDLPGAICDDGDATTGNDVYDANCNCTGQLIDCEGVVGGSALPGSTCDDGDATTGNDVYDANCNCAGQLIDCEGVTGGSALPGTACDDMDPNTANDVYDANCNCGGAALDCEGVPGGTAVPGSVCDDMDATTGNDTYQPDCTCAGQLIDCEGVAGGAALPGTACDDMDPNTANDVYDANCNCGGAALDCEGVPGGTAVPGSVCDDMDATTGNDTYQPDCTCAGQLIDCEGVVGGSALPGATCDDMDATTGNDVYDANCNCAGQLIDCEGVAGGSALPGSTCDDMDATTGNDVYDANCNCAGQLIDCEGVVGGSALPGTTCDDMDATTGNDLYDANCNCAGQLIDCEGEIGGTALPGTTCDDMDPNTANDVFDANCNCAGTNTGTGNNNVSLVLNTDNNGSETSWEIVGAGTSTPLCSGANYPSNQVSSEVCTLPDGCYELRVFDAMGDGMFNGVNGGYALYDQNNDAIIDNFDDGQFGALSALFSNTAFCLPLGTSKVRFADCGKLDFLPNEFIIAEGNPAVANEFGTGNQTDDGFKYWFFDPDGTYQRRIFISHANPSIGAPPGPWAVNHLKLANMYTNPLPMFIKLNVRVQSIVNGASSPYGPACVIAIDPTAAACPTAKLEDDPSNANYSCGVTRSFGNADKLWAKPEPGANKYKFEFVNSSEGFTRRIAFNSYVCLLNWSVKPLSIGATYQVRVAVSFDNGINYCPYGNPCDVTILPQASAANRALTTPKVSAKLYPNPLRQGPLFVQLENLDMNTNVHITISDLSGKLIHQVSSQSSALEAGLLTVELDQNLPTGTYLVTVSSNNAIQTELLVIGK